MIKKYIGTAKCKEAKFHDGKIATYEDQIVYLDRNDWGYSYTPRSEWATTFEDPVKLKHVMRLNSHQPWYYEIKPETITIHDVTHELHRWTKDELIARVKELEAFVGTRP